MLVISMKDPIRCCSLGKDVPSAARSLDWTTEFVEDPPMFGTQDYVSGPRRNICWGPCMAINSAAKCGLMARIIHQLDLPTWSPQSDSMPPFYPPIGRHYKGPRQWILLPADIELVNYSGHQAAFSSAIDSHTGSPTYITSRA